MEKQQQASYSQELAPVIWKHPNHVTSIFPHPLNPKPMTLQNDSQKKRRYLRAEMNSTDSSDVMTELTRVYSTKELAFFYDNTWPSSASSMSKIYLTGGRAVLDPSLVAAAALPRHGHVDPSSLSKAIIPSWQVTSSSPHQSSSTTASTSSRESSFSNIRSSPSSSSPNQLLTMIIPATTIQWGGSAWIDGDSPHASHNILDLLMRNMNLTSFAMENGLIDEDNNIDISSLSVEIACNVLKARIVKDVVVVSEGHKEDMSSYDA
jgi:hypothetical protein